ncbi:MAG: 50S ribosomal protein L17 [Candidatus Saccharibacteria bacterium]
MHRHGYKGRKFHRERDQREALMAGLADSLVKYESIETTLMKAKEIVPFFEKLITKAKKGDLHSRRQVISSLQTIESAHKLVDEIAPKLAGRNSGHLRIVRTSLRRGDNTQLARVSFVDDISVNAEKTTPKIAKTVTPKVISPKKPKTTAKVAKKETK